MTFQRLMLHTDMPLDRISFLIGGLGHLQVGTAAGHGGPDCIYGWCEPWDEEKTCKPHHLVDDMSPEMIMVLAVAIDDLGHQVVVTDWHDWSQVPNEFPSRYDDDHSH
jgi:hypothetical protein